jgi:hypothetical protein
VVQELQVYLCISLKLSKVLGITHGSNVRIVILEHTPVIIKQLVISNKTSTIHIFTERYDLVERGLVYAPQLKKTIGEGKLVL